MYLSSVRSAGPPSGKTTRAVPATVIGLGVVSLITDMSAEMVTAVLPLYLVHGLGVGYLQLGAIDGLYTGATAVLRLLGGHLADRLWRPKAVALTGYGLSALTKLGFPLAGSSVAALGLVIGVDRAGKGIRTGPRDAMITQAAPADALGRAFGVHRALDTAGALLGPLLAFGLLSLLVMDYTAVFAVSFCLAVLVFAMFVRAPAAVPAIMPKLSWAPLRDRDLRRVCLFAGLLGLCTVGDMFLFVGVQRTTGLPLGVLPLLPLATALIFMVAAAPVGRLADKFGRWKVFLAGHVVLLVGYVLVARLVRGRAGFFGTRRFLRVHRRRADGLAGPLVPECLRATGLALVQTAQAVARAAGAVLFGVVANGLGLAPAFGLFALLLVGAIAAGACR